MVEEQFLKGTLREKDSLVGKWNYWIQKQKSQIEVKESRIITEIIVAIISDRNVEREGWSLWRWGRRSRQKNEKNVEKDVSSQAKCKQIGFIKDKLVREV
jgi:hypothetical protein